MTRRKVIERLKTWETSCTKAREEYSNNKTVFKSDVQALKQAIKYAEEYKNPFEWIGLGIFIGWIINLALFYADKLLK